MDSKETLEEAIEKYIQSKEWLNEGADKWIHNIFIKGVDWQAERMYSENDLRQAFKDGQNNASFSDMHGFTRDLTEEQWFEQFKKK